MLRPQTLGFNQGAAVWCMHVCSRASKVASGACMLPLCALQAAAEGAHSSITLFRRTTAGLGGPPAVCATAAAAAAAAACFHCRPPVPTPSTAPGRRTMVH